MPAARPHVTAHRTRAIPRWATVGVVLYTAAAFIAVLVTVFEHRGAWAAFLALWVLPIQEGIAWVHALETAQWGWVVFLGGHLVAVVLYAVAARRALRLGAGPKQSASAEHAG